MATPDLDKKKIEAGMKLLTELDKNPALDIIIALWYFETDLEHWEFLIYTPEFYKKITDLKDFYRIVDDCLMTHSDISEYINLSEVLLLSHSKEHIITVMRIIKENVAFAYFSYPLSINSTVIEGIYIDSLVLCRNNI
jgi:hypothetical protein